MHLKRFQKASEEQCSAWFYWCFCCQVPLKHFDKYFQYFTKINKSNELRNGSVNESINILPSFFRSTKTTDWSRKLPSLWQKRCRQLKICNASVFYFSCINDYKNLNLTAVKFLYEELAAYENTGREERTEAEASGRTENGWVPAQHCAGLLQLGL